MGRSTGITLDKGGGEPLYRQLFDQVVERVRSGAFPPGYRLPPTRALATELSTNRNTVALGTLAPPSMAEPTEGGMPWASLVSSQVKAESLRRAQRFNRPVASRDVVNLTRMQPSNDLLPDRLIRRCFDHVLRTLGPRALGYGPPEGLANLRELVVADLARQGVPAHVDDVIITTGSQQGLDLIARTLIGPGDTFLIDAATYGGAINVFSLAGARLVPVPSDPE